MVATSESLLFRVLWFHIRKQEANSKQVRIVPAMTHPRAKEDSPQVAVRAGETIDLVSQLAKSLTGYDLLQFRVRQAGWLPRPACNHRIGHGDCSIQWFSPGGNERVQLVPNPQDIGPVLCPQSSQECAQTFPELSISTGVAPWGCQRCGGDDHQIQRGSGPGSLQQGCGLLDRKGFPILELGHRNRSTPAIFFEK